MLNVHRSLPPVIDQGHSTPQQASGAASGHVRVTTAAPPALCAVPWREASCSHAPRSDEHQPAVPRGASILLAAVPPVARASCSHAPRSDSTSPPSPWREHPARMPPAATSTMPAVPPVARASCSHALFLPRGASILLACPPQRRAPARRPPVARASCSHAPLPPRFPIPRSRLDPPSTVS